MVSDCCSGSHRNRVYLGRYGCYKAAVNTLLDEHVERVPAMSRLDESREFVPVGIAILTVSDTRMLADDKSGTVLVERIAEAGHRLAARSIVTDDVGGIRQQVETWIADRTIDVIISTGGTGFTGRDNTPEAIKPLFDKEIDGFAILFHHLSYGKVGTSTIQSRCCGGLAKGTYIFCLPGSPGACRDAWDGILKWQLDNRHRPCNLVEIMPRLMESAAERRHAPP